MSTQTEQQNETTTNSTPPTTHAGLAIDGFRIFAEAWLLICQIVSAVSLAVATETPSGVTWTLLSLCITTLVTFIQFYNETGKGAGKNIFLSLPFIGFFLVTILLFVASAVPEVKAFVENKIVSVSICVVIIIRQVCHLVTLVQCYHYNNKPVHEVND